MDEARFRLGWSEGDRVNTSGYLQDGDVALHPVGASRFFLRICYEIPSTLAIGDQYRLTFESVESSRLLLNREYLPATDGKRWQDFPLEGDVEDDEYQAKFWIEYHDGRSQTLIDAKVVLRASA